MYMYISRHRKVEFQTIKLCGVGTCTCMFQITCTCTMIVHVHVHVHRMSKIPNYCVHELEFLASFRVHNV